VTSGECPLIILDVDGPCNPYAAKATRRPVGYETFRLRPREWTDPNNRRAQRGLRVWLNPRHGDVLGALADVTGAELVWCTTWLDQANTLIGPLIGLPELPVISWDPGASNWKYDAVLRYANDRPLAWFDDDFGTYPTLRDQFIDRRRPRPTLLRYVDPKIGLSFDDIVVVRNWLHENGGVEGGEAS
jgi:hypothetical protein